MPSFLEDVTAAIADRYTIERQVGMGGMATVFQAQDTRHNRPVAIKVLQPALAAALGAERFLREIEIAANLTHPHILPLFDSGEARGFLYYVMPLLTGESLRERIDRQKQLALEDALRIGAEVADALGYAHSHGLVHRDIKPENIMFEGRHAVVTDFGIARAVSAVGEQRLTQTGLVVGTPMYMSPEQAAGEKDLDGRSDIYALGCVLHEMLAGQPPFTGPTVESIIQQHLAADVPAITAIRLNVPEQVAAVIRRAMQKTPADRYAKGAELAKDLELAAAQVRVSGSLPASDRGGTGTSTAAPPARPRRVIAAAGLGSIALVAAIGFLLVSGNGATAPTGTLPRLTVLPFENTGGDEDQYFADGITDEVTARLTGIQGLTLIGRQSAEEYKNSAMAPPEIGRELGVDYVLAGSVWWQRPQSGPSRVRVIPTLHKLEDSSVAWSEVYNEELTQVFDVQTAIATRVAEQLDIALLAPERQSLVDAPTGNLSAYDFYLQGNGYYRRPINEENARLAQNMYARALALDSSFALAAAKLAIVHARMYWYYFDRSAERVRLAEESIAKALALAPDDPAVRFARGMLHYWLYLNYDEALEEFNVARAVRPNDSELLQSIGTVERRQGNWTEAATHIAQAAALEPRSPSDAIQAGVTYLYLRDYAQAQQYFERAITLAPEQSRPRVWAGRLYMSWRGDTARVRQLFEPPQMANPRELDPQMWWHWALFRVLDGSSQTNLRRLSRVAKNDAADSAFVYVAAAELYALDNRSFLARANYDSARTLLERLVARSPEEARFHSELGVAYAGLGQRDDAINEAQQAVALVPISREALIGTDWLRNLAQIYVMLGMHDEAVEQLRQILSVPSGLSGRWIALDPIWSPLRSHAGFHQLTGTP